MLRHGAAAPVEARQELYKHARAALARQLEQDPTQIKRERRALENAIQQVERAKPAYTALLITSIFFLGQLWLLFYTSHYVPSPMLLMCQRNGDNSKEKETVGPHGSARRVVKTRA